MTRFERLLRYASVGFAIVIAGCDDATGVAPGVASLRISPSDTTVLGGTSFNLTVVGVDASGNPLTRQPTIVFEVDRPGFISIDATGRVSTLQPGTVNVTARLAEKPSDPRIARARIAIGADIR